MLCIRSDELQKVLETNYIKEAFSKETVLEMMKEVSAYGVRVVARQAHLEAQNSEDRAMAKA